LVLLPGALRLKHSPAAARAKRNLWLPGFSHIGGIDGPPTVALLTTATARAAANDDAAETADAVRNPLWIILIGMACFLALRRSSWRWADQGRDAAPGVDVSTDTLQRRAEMAGQRLRRNLAAIEGFSCSP
jgi:hypothetical protein